MSEAQKDMHANTLFLNNKMKRKMCWVLLGY